MKRVPSGRPSPAMVVALIALFISLGGVSYGVASGSIDSREIRNNSVRSKDIKNSSVKSRDVHEGTLRSGDIRDREVRARDLADGAVGGRHVAPDALTGAHVDESRLGQVPSAGSAGDAALLDGIDSSAFMRSRSRLFDATDGLTLNFADNAPLLTLANLPPGQYLIMGRLQYDNDSPGGEAHNCKLSAPGESDTTEFLVGPDNDMGAILVPLQLAYTSGSTFSATISCNSSGDEDAASLSSVAVAVD